MKRDGFGFVDLNEYIKGNNKYSSLIHFSIGDKRYYYRSCRIEEFYNELVVSRIAKLFGIKCPRYDLGEVGTGVGVFSQDLNDYGTFISVDELIKDLYGIDDYNEERKFNNLEDLRELFQKKFDNEEIVDSLMQQLDDLFVFDVFVGNSDRNITNFGVLVTDDDISIAIIDNSNSLDEDVLINDDNQVHVSRSEKSLDSLIKKRPEEFKNYILEKIGNVDLPTIFESIEEDIGADIIPDIKTKIEKFFEKSTSHIKRVVSKSKVKSLQ